MSSVIKNVSLYIPHVYTNYDKDFIINVFKNLDIGQVKYVDFVLKFGKDGKEYYAAYIHFENWFENETALNFQERVLNPNKEARLIYEDPWYWIVLENKSQRPVSGERKRRIDLSEFLNQLETIKETLDIPSVTDSTHLHLNNRPQEEDDEYDAVLEEILDEMDDCEAAIEEEDQCLVSIDSRYIQMVEQENLNLRMQLNQMYSDLYLKNLYFNNYIPAQEYLHV
jgi:hypothetical protein